MFLIFAHSYLTNLKVKVSESCIFVFMYVCGLFGFSHLTILIKYPRGYKYFDYEL